ncbi:hypothetical protein Hdeb2414_s0002g00049801 [Helianthus debilis subsp. tardiflorus]
MVESLLTLISTPHDNYNINILGYHPRTSRVGQFKLCKQWLNNVHRLYHLIL